MLVHRRQGVADTDAGAATRLPPLLPLRCRRRLAKPLGVLLLGGGDSGPTARLFHAITFF